MKHEEKIYELLTDLENVPLASKIIKKELKESTVLGFAAMLHLKGLAFSNIICNEIDIDLTTLKNNLFEMHVKAFNKPLRYSPKELYNSALTYNHTSEFSLKYTYIAYKDELERKHNVALKNIKNYDK
jgi:hypothetical protein